jgi:hypothetical protein
MSSNLWKIKKGILFLPFEAAVDLSKGELRAPTASSSSPSERILLPPL